MGKFEPVHFSPFPFLLLYLCLCLDPHVTHSRHATSQEDELTDLDDLMLGGGDRMGNADSEGGDFTDWSR